MHESIDERVLDEQTCSEPGLKHDVLRLFILEAEALHAMMSRDREPGALADDLHRIRGAARAIGARGLGDVAETCEAALRSRRSLPSDMAARLQDALAETCRFAAVLQAGLDETASPNDLKADKHSRPSMSHPDQRDSREADS